MDVGVLECATLDDNDEDSYWEYKLERSAALFLISLKKCFEITQGALNFTVSQVHQMIEFAVES